MLPRKSSIIYSEGVFVALGIQHETRISPCFIICSLPGSTIFSTLAHKKHVSLKTVTEKTCVF